MKGTQWRVLLAGAAATALTVTLLPPAAAAQSGGSPQTGVTVEVVAEGLNVPRGLAYDPLLGRVLVAESGNAAGNDGECAEGFGGSVYCYGETGSIYQYSENWWLTSQRVVEGLPSIWAPDIAGYYDVVLGLHDISLPYGTGPVVGVFGLSGPESFRDDLEAHHPRAAHLGTAAWVSASEITTIGDVAHYEETDNPHPSNVDSNPFGVATDGLRTYAVDAGGNFVVRIGPTGNMKTVAVPPDQTDPNGVVRESVPSTAAFGPDGKLYIGELAAAFAPLGFARVWRVESNGNLTMVADGFTDIVSIDFDHEGRLLVLEMAENGYYQNPLPDGDRTGRLVRVEHDGTQTELLTDGLVNPGGVVAAQPGVLYVSNYSATLGGDGQLLRVTVND